MFYQPPSPGQRVRWQAQGPNPVVRFQQGELVVLWCQPPLPDGSADNHGPLLLALLGLYEPAGGEMAGEVMPPILLLGRGEQLGAAPICLLEIPEPAQYQWLNDRRSLQLTLVILSPDPDAADVAVVQAQRRIMPTAAQGWPAVQQALRLRLEKQLLDTSDDLAGWVQQAGRDLVADTPVRQLLEQADWQAVVAGNGANGAA